MQFLLRKQAWLILAVIVMCCASENTAEKIGFDLEILNLDGLYGPANGLRALDYEFCIPADSTALDEVESIDPSSRCGRGTGRIGCGTNQFLCLGNTHQKEHKDILTSLAQLAYVETIEQAFFE